MFSFNTLRLYGLKAIFLGIGSLSCVGVMQTPAEAATLHVPGQYSTIQAAINAANLGDTIIVEAGRTYTENLVLRYKSSGSGYITIQSSALANLPAAGNRVSPADAANMPTIRSTGTGGNTVIRTESGNNPTGYYRLIGLRITRGSGSGQQTTLIELGTTGSSQNTLAKVPHNIIIDRCLIEGANGTSTRRGITLNSRDTQIVNSYIHRIHEQSADSQAIGGWNGPGGYLIANNYLEAASENIMFGGSDPSIPNLVTTDVTIERNHIYKPLSWRNQGWDVKNSFELKNAKQVIVQENIFENSWGEAQNGTAIVFTPRNQDGGCSWCTIEDVTFRYNIVKNVAGGFNIFVTDNIHPSRVTQNFDINNNLITVAVNTLNGNGWGALIHGSSSRGQMNDLRFDHNTFIHLENAAYYNTFLEFDSSTNILANFTVNNNLVAGVENTNNNIGLPRSNQNNGTNALNQAALNGSYTFNKNALQRSSAGMPNTSFYTTSRSSIRFEDYTGGNYALRTDSPYKNAGTDGKDIGADIAGLNERTACVVSGRQSDCAGSSVTAHDFDGDGKADISVFRPGNGVWYLNRSRDGFAGVGFGNSADLVAPGDFDGDGKADIAVFRPSTGIWYILNSSDWSATIRQFGMAGDVPVVADYDGDGRADIAVWRPSNGVWYRLNSSNGQFQGGQFGMLGDRPAVGDYDGDGRADLAVFRPSNGVWYLNRSTAGVYVVQFGQATDRIAPADFTGDGRTDIAVWRPSNGTWYRLDQTTGQMSAVQFGSPGDIPVPADYDGDGRADLTVFRPSNGIWYLQKSSEGFAAMQFGSTGDIPPASALMQ
ncbi:MAG TPA: VCBS repeat-containing protein [Pyrinomonadaceae bacterium]|nr:VCBS repeat-containing protein [Pyrinomonadaceae bacterium]HMP66308.1 VCBS repeat-containing protein [Pyrinomonadaceae bacterium]